MERAASAGESELSTETAWLLPADSLGVALGPGMLPDKEPGEIEKLRLVPGRKCRPLCSRAACPPLSVPTS